MSKIVIHHQGRLVGEQSLRPGIQVIGRMPGQDIRLDNLGISRRHAFILGDVTGRIFILEDMKSLNGTFVNKRRIEKCLLKPGDVIAMGENRLEFVMENDSPPPTESASAGPEVIELDSGRKHRLNKDVVYFGNSSQDDILVPGLMVGKRFASIDRKGNLWILNLLVKRFSRLQLNGEDVHSAKLKEGDELNVAGVKFLFHLPSQLNGVPGVSPEAS